MGAAPIPFIDPSQAAAAQGPLPAQPPASAPAPQAAPDPTPAPQQQAVAAPTPAPQGQAVAAPTPAQGAAAGGQAGPQADPNGGWGSRTLHGILKALDGTQDVQYQVNPQTGQLVASQVDSGPGSMAKRIIAGAVTGLAAGAGAAPGPGHVQRGLAAGIGAGAQAAQQRDEQARADALGNYQRLDQSKLRNAQLALSNQQLLASTHQMNREDVDAAEHEEDSLNQWREMVNGNPENVSLGIVTPKPGQTLAQATTAAIAANPAALSHQAKGTLVTHKVVTDGKVTGYEAAIVTPAWKDQLNDKPFTFRKDRVDPKTGEITTDEQTVPAGAGRNGDLLTQNNAVQTANNTLRIEKYKSDQTARTAREDTQARTGAELGSARIAANAGITEAEIRAKAEQDALNVRLGQNANPQTGETTIRAVTKQIFDGRVVPPPLGSGRGLQQTQAQYADFDAYAQQMGLPKIDPAKLIGDYKYANNPIVKNNLANLSTLTGTATHPGVLALLQQASTALGQTQFPALNNAGQWARLAAGDPRVAAYRGLLLDAQDLTAKILAGGGTGSATSDAKLKAGQDLYDKGFNARQMSATVDQQHQVLDARRDATVGNNFYLNRWYGKNGIGDPDEQQKQSAGQGGQGAAPPGNVPQSAPAPATHVFNARAWAQANPGKDVNQAMAQARQQGFQVTQ